MKRRVVVALLVALVFSAAITIAAVAQEDQPAYSIGLVNGSEIALRLYNQPGLITELDFWANGYDPGYLDLSLGVKVLAPLKPAGLYVGGGVSFAGSYMPLFDCQEVCDDYGCYEGCGDTVIGHQWQGMPPLYKFFVTFEGAMAPRFLISVSPGITFSNGFWGLQGEVGFYYLL